MAQAGQFGAVTVATNMAGRGTDIMLGGNAEYMATNDLRKAGYTDEVIADATGYAETDNSEILEARQMFADKLRQHKEEISGEADRVRQAGGLFIIGTERMIPAGSITSCAAVPAARATPARPGSTSPWRMT